MPKTSTKFDQITPSEFFYRNRDLAGFSNPAKALYTATRELVENSLDACESSGILPKINVRLIPTSEDESKTDPRNYKVSFEKITNSLNFDTKKSVRDSVLEILKQVKSGNIDPRDSEFSNMSKLTEKIKSLSNYQFDENL